MNNLEKLAYKRLIDLYRLTKDEVYFNEIYQRVETLRNKIYSKYEIDRDDFDSLFNIVLVRIVNDRDLRNSHFTTMLCANVTTEVEIYCFKNNRRINAEKHYTYINKNYKSNQNILDNIISDELIDKLNKKIDSDTRLHAKKDFKAYYQEGLTYEKVSIRRRVSKENIRTSIRYMERELYNYGSKSLDIELKRDKYGHIIDCVF